MTLLLRSHLPLLVRCTFWSGILAVCTAAYGFAAGPALRLMFGGTELAWPPAIATVMPLPPSVDLLAIWLPGLIIAASLLKGISYHRYQVTTEVLGQRVLVDIHTALHAALLASSGDGVAMRGGGEWISRFGTDAPAVQRLVTHGGAMAIRDALTAFTLISACFLLDWRLAMVSFVIYPLAFWPVITLGRRLRRLATHVLEEQGRLTGLLLDHVDRLQIIQVRGEEKRAKQYFSARVNAKAATSIKSAAVAALPSPFTELLGAAALALTLLYTADRVRAGDVAPENVMSFFATLMLLYQPIKGLSRLNTVWQPGLSAWRRICEFSVPLGQLPRGGHRYLDTGKPPEILCENLILRRGQNPVIGPLALRLPAGKITVLTGQNGSGKTSLALALARMIEILEGSIEVNGHPLAEFEARAWRRNIGWLPQNLCLGRGSVLDNLMAGDSTVSEETVANILDICGLSKVVERLPDGLSTKLGDDGAGLSGGERQRLALARALIHEPRVLVLDEPDAFLDQDGIEGLIALIKEVAVERTVLLISHDQRLLALGDLVVSLEWTETHLKGAAL